MYGLDVACSFLLHICTDADKRSDPTEWLSVYLIGSLCVLWPSFSSLSFNNMAPVEYLAATLMFQLTQLDHSQPRMISELSNPPYVPPEVMALITGNSLISLSLALQAASCSSIHREANQERGYGASDEADS